MDIRKDFFSATSHLERLILYGDEFAKNNRENWPHLKNKEDFKNVYGMDEDSRYKFERIYSRGKDLAVDMSFKLDAFNDVLEYPTITSYVMSFYDENGKILGIKELEEISSQAKRKRDDLGYDCPWAVEQMILLFDKQLNLLRHVSETLDLLKKTEIYKIENGIVTSDQEFDKTGTNRKTQRRSKQKGNSKKKPDAAIVVAILSLIGTIIAAILASPVLITFIQRTPAPTAVIPTETNIPKPLFDVIVTIEGEPKQEDPSFPMNYPPLKGITIEARSVDNSIDHCTWDIEWAVNDPPPNSQNCILTFPSTPTFGFMTVTISVFTPDGKSVQQVLTFIPKP